jgi:predicted TIM-barrel fold metal-dependent hydrolase
LLIDVHTHYMTQSNWGTEWTNHWKPAYGYDFPNIQAEDFDEAMQEVDIAVVFGITANAAGVFTSNEQTALFCEKTQTKTIGFMALDPTDPKILSQVQNGISLGLKGIKLYPVLALFDPRAAAHNDFFAMVQDEGLVLIWHMGATPSPLGNLAYTNPLVVDNVAQSFPKIIQIIAHMGHPWQRECFLVLRKNKNVYADVSGSWSRPSEGFNALVRAQEWGVVNKLLFGSDFPLWTPLDAKQGLKKLQSYSVGNLPGIAPETIDTILNQNVIEKFGWNKSI